MLHQSCEDITPGFKTLGAGCLRSGPLPLRSAYSNLVSLHLIQIQIVASSTVFFTYVSLQASKEESAQTLKQDRAV